MPTSNTEPKIIELNTVKQGIANILVHWDIKANEIIEETGKSTLLYQYEECRMNWVLPKKYSTKSGVDLYLKSIESEILDWAKGSKAFL